MAKIKTSLFILAAMSASALLASPPPNPSLTITNNSGHCLMFAAGDCRGGWLTPTVPYTMKKGASQRFEAKAGSSCFDIRVMEGGSQNLAVGGLFSSWGGDKRATWSDQWVTYRQSLSGENATVEITATSPQLWMETRVPSCN